MEAAFYMTVNLNDDEATAQAEANEYLTRYYGSNIWGGRWGPFGDHVRLIERIQLYAEAGADTIIIRFASFDQMGQLRRLIKHVLPAFG